MSSDSKLKHALALASAGFYVFRLAPNSKNPVAGISWSEVSSRDPEVITSWWTDVLGWELDYNIGIDCGKSGWIVIDVDTKEGKHGRLSFDELSSRFNFPDTYRVQTASGGFHIYYRDTRPVGHRNTTSKLARDIDTRGVGGFVVAEGSTVTLNGVSVAYTRLEGAPEAIAELSDPLLDWLAPSSLSAKAAEPSASVSADADIDIEAAVDFLKTAEPAVQGSGGDHHTFVTICQLKEFGISAKTALDLLEEHWNPNCSPPWDHADLIVKVRSAYKSATQTTGVRSATEFNGVYIGDVPEKPKLVIPATPIEIYSEFDIPPREWVFDGIAMRKQVTIVVAPGGQGKSTFTLTMGASKSTNNNILGINPLGQGNVWLWNNEDNREELKRRLVAIMKYNKIPMSELWNHDILGAPTTARLFMDSGEQRAFRVAKRNANGILVPSDAQGMIDSIRQNNIDMVIIDPFAETHPAKENDNEEILEVARMYRSIAQLANCAVVLVHHTRKLESASSEGHSGNLDSMRGASSLGGVARVVVTFNTMNKKQAKLFNVEEARRGRYAVLEGAKANFSAAADSFKVYERFAEVINMCERNPDGEKVGILRPVQLEAKPDSPKETEYQLLKSIAACCDHQQLTIKDIAQQLTEEFAFYHDKRPEAMAKMIRRLFDGKESYVLDNGELFIRKGTGQRGQPTIFLEFIGIAASIAEML